MVIESTYNWYFLVDGLMDAGYRVHLANTTAIKKYEGLKYSGDFADAAYLAQLLRLGLLPEGYIYPREERAGRDLGRKRMQLVRCQTMQILAIESILARQTGGRMSSNQVKRLTAQQVEGLGLVPDVALAMEANRAVSETLQQQIEVLEKRLQQRVKLRPEYRLLKTVPGIGETLATTIMLEMGTIARFASVGNFSSYCRCVDSRRESNGKKKGEGNAKNGNKYLRLGVCGGPPTSRCATARRPSASTSVRSARATASWRSRRSRTNSRGRATTCCASRSPSMCSAVLCNGLAKGGEPDSGLEQNPPNDWTPSLCHPMECR